MNYDTANEMFRLAADLVNQSSRNIFLTGKAGTGKTTFLKYIKENCPKQVAVVAPTGAAAINAGGVTIHSFFQLGFSPFVPEEKGFLGKSDEIISKHSLISRLRMSNEKKKVLQQLELLIIDEISMVRCDTVDALDTILRHVRQRYHERFGGVQLLFIGDMFQLPPVTKEQEWRLLSGYYDSPYFFDSRVIKEDPPLYIEFNKIYRQSETQFIELLNQVRNNDLDEGGIKILDSRFNSAFRREKQDDYIILTTHNDKARDINVIQLQNLNSRPISFNAEITGEFYDNAYPADEILQLKAGAQVMFIKNDTEKDKRYFNGKIGVITMLDNDNIFVQCKGEADEIEVKKEKWENIRYTFNKSTRLLDEEVLGSFTQYPLRLAWAITIHKSQGLTFEKAIIDAGEAFAPGQVYVALSRCTNLEGMVLQSRVRPSSLFSDNRIVQFSQKSASANQLQNELAASRKKYEQELLILTFDFTTAINHGEDVLKYLGEHLASFNPETFSWLEEFLGKMNNLQATASKFHQQLQALFLQHTLADQNNFLQERVNAAASYFAKELETLLETIQHSPAVTDSRLHAKEFNDSLKEIFGQFAIKKFLMEGCIGAFEIESYHRRKRSFVLPQFTINAYAAGKQLKSESPHPVLHQQLRKLRDSICSKKDIPVYIVAGTKTIDEMAEYLPLTLEELEKISGFGKVKIQTYGQQFVELIQQYCTNNNLTSRIQEKTPKRQHKDSSTTKGTKINTRVETYKLFKEGMLVADIAKTRTLTRQTIEGHLAYYVNDGSINIEKLISREKLHLIEAALKEFNGESIKPVKDKLGDAAGFGEIKLVIAWKDFKRNTQQQ